MILWDVMEVVVEGSEDNVVVSVEVGKETGATRHDVIPCDDLDTVVEVDVAEERVVVRVEESNDEVAGIRAVRGVDVFGAGRGRFVE